MHHCVSFVVPHPSIPCSLLRIMIKKIRNAVPDKYRESETTDAGQSCERSLKTILLYQSIYLQSKHQPQTIVRWVTKIRIALLKLLFLHVQTDVLSNNYYTIIHPGGSVLLNLRRSPSDKFNTHVSIRQSFYQTW